MNIIYEDGAGLEKGADIFNGLFFIFFFSTLFKIIYVCIHMYM